MGLLKKEIVGKIPVGYTIRHLLQDSEFMTLTDSKNTFGIKLTDHSKQLQLNKCQYKNVSLWYQKIQ